MLFLLFLFLCIKIFQKKNIKLLKKELNKLYPNNNLSISQIHYIINKNKHCLPETKYKGKYNKISIQIENFIIDSIKKNNCLTANDITRMICDKFNINLSLTSIYNIFKKNNYVYKKTKINVNPYSFDDQKQHLLNVYEHLNNNDDDDILNDSNNNELIKLNDHIKKFDLLTDENIKTINKNVKSINEDFKLINDADNINYFNEEKNIFKKKELISIDEMSIITNRTPTKGWALINNECVVSIPCLKPNKRYSLLLATSKKKIIKYLLVEGSVKTDDYISFIEELNKDNTNYSYLIDNASIHKNKKTFAMYKKEKINVIFNAPYQSEFNPIEMVFSLLRKKLNKKIVKNKIEITEVINDFIKETKESILTNIFNHSKNTLKKYLKI